ncbi:hypothetical protein [Tahibacter amnicola]|uniref:Transmembrane protein n=1 Tax=Tahibacter amnicola TaxID=2976241 RepID=A0ABY6BKS8_9GAMM|nr:hypothetical protein [Tahibacter amnicola]UXI69191.1 hypothetical protein N4264_05965 [Tahibacter amnicola]
MSLLALVLFSPWFSILSWVYWRFPADRTGDPRRRRFDIAAIVLAVALGAAAMHGGYVANIGIGGGIWKQVIATLYGYGSFLGVLAVAFVLRRRIVRAAG